jgi:hypothetical protein
LIWPIDGNGDVIGSVLITIAAVVLSVLLGIAQFVTMSDQSKFAEQPEIIEVDP